MLILSGRRCAKGSQTRGENSESVMEHMRRRRKSISSTKENEQTSPSPACRGLVLNIGPGLGEETSEAHEQRRKRIGVVSRGEA
jgi:hypothetical protein